LVRQEDAGKFVHLETIEDSDLTLQTVVCKIAVQSTKESHNECGHKAGRVCPLNIDVNLEMDK
jgi:hypothetical protein